MRTKRSGRVLTAVLAALLMTGTGAGATPNPPGGAGAVATDFPVSLRTAPEHRLGEPVVVDFELRNATDRDVSVLVWDTPLEGWTLAFVRVRRDGVELPYDGPSIKRGNPDAASYVPVPAGGSVRASFDLTSAFAITEPGEYTAVLDARLRDVVAGAPSTRTLADLTAVGLDAVEVTFRVLPGAAPRATGGELARRATAPADARLEPNPPAFNGGTPQQQQVITQAHEKGYDYARDAFGEVFAQPDSGTPRYVEWFGSYTGERHGVVRDSYRKVMRYFTDETITYTPHGDRCKDTYYAYTYFGAKAVWLCPVFWRVDLTGINSKAGTIVHELSHAAAHTGDHAYGVEGAKWLAANDPGRAVTNADNYEYFAETTY